MTAAISSHLVSTKNFRVTLWRDSTTTSPSKQPKLCLRINFVRSFSWLWRVAWWRQPTQAPTKWLHTLGGEHNKEVNTAYRSSLAKQWTDYIAAWIDNRQERLQLQQRYFNLKITCLSLVLKVVVKHLKTIVPSMRRVTSRMVTSGTKSKLTAEDLSNDLRLSSERNNRLSLPIGSFTSKLRIEDSSTRWSVIETPVLTTSRGKRS